MAVAVAVAVRGGVAVPVAVPVAVRVAGLTKRFFNYCGRRHGHRRGGDPG